MMSIRTLSPDMRESIHYPFVTAGIRKSINSRKAEKKLGFGAFISYF